MKLTDPSSGTVTLSTSGTFTYIPNADFVGDDSFTYKATSGSLESSTVTASIRVIDSSATSVAINDAYSTLQDTGLVVSSAVNGLLSNDTGTSALANAEGPFHGTLDLASDGTFTYTPDAGYTGADSFVYSAGSNTAMVMITVRAASDPMAANDSYSMYKDAVLGIAAPGIINNDAGTALTASLVSGPLNGTPAALSSDGSFRRTLRTVVSAEPTPSCTG